MRIPEHMPSHSLRRFDALAGFSRDRQSGRHTLHLSHSAVARTFSSSKQQVILSQKARGRTTSDATCPAGSAATAHIERLWCQLHVTYLSRSKDDTGHNWLSLDILAASVFWKFRAGASAERSLHPARGRIGHWRTSCETKLPSTVHSSSSRRSLSPACNWMAAKRRCRFSKKENNRRSPKRYQKRFVRHDFEADSSGTGLRRV